LRRIRQVLAVFLGLLAVGSVVLACRTAGRSIFVDASTADRRWLCFYVYKGELAICFSSANLPPFGGNTGPGWPSIPFRSNVINSRLDSQRNLAFFRSRYEAERLKGSYVAEHIEPQIRKLEADHTKKEARHREGHAMVITRCLRARALLGFFFKCDLTPDTELILLFPFWALTLLFSAYPATVVARWQIGRRRRLANACICCGYDLTGNVSGVCSECGTPIPEKQNPSLGEVARFGATRRTESERC
jgi:hypothetical protein